MPRCGALIFLQKPLNYKGGSAETAASLNMKLRILVVVTSRVLPPLEPNSLFEFIWKKKQFRIKPKKADEERAVSNVEYSKKIFFSLRSWGPTTFFFCR
jgi:hypothetical protein